MEKVNLIKWVIFYERMRLTLDIDQILCEKPLRQLSVASRLVATNYFRGFEVDE